MCKSISGYLITHAEALGWTNPYAKALSLFLFTKVTGRPHQNRLTACAAAFHLFARYHELLALRPCQEKVLVALDDQPEIIFPFFPVEHQACAYGSELAVIMEAAGELTDPASDTFQSINFKFHDWPPLSMTMISRIIKRFASYFLTLYPWSGHLERPADVDHNCLDGT